MRRKLSVSEPSRERSRRSKLKPIVLSNNNFKKRKLKQSVSAFNSKESKRKQLRELVFTH